MKRILYIECDAFCNNFKYFDVSTEELLTNAYMWIFHKILKSEIASDIDRLNCILQNSKTIESCDICNKTGEVIIQGEPFKCPSCNATSISEVCVFDEDWIELRNAFENLDQSDEYDVRNFIETYGYLFDFDNHFEIFNINNALDEISEML